MKNYLIFCCNPLFHLFFTYSRNSLNIIDFDYIINYFNYNYYSIGKASFTENHKKTNFELLIIDLDNFFNLKDN